MRLTAFLCTFFAPAFIEISFFIKPRFTGTHIYNVRISAPITYSPSKFKHFLSELKPDSTYRGRALKAS